MVDKAFVFIPLGSITLLLVAGGKGRSSLDGPGMPYASPVRFGPSVPLGGERSIPIIVLLLLPRGTLGHLRSEDDTFLTRRDHVGVTNFLCGGYVQFLGLPKGVRNSIRNNLS